MTERLQVVVCPVCKDCKRIDLPGPHAPRFVVRQGRYVLVDCVGAEVSVPLQVGVGR